MMKAESPSALIDAKIEELGDWRGDMLARVRALIKEADPEIVEEWKWRGVPVWEHAGIVCTGPSFSVRAPVRIWMPENGDGPGARRRRPTRTP
jgi:hypothetical protein